MNPFWTQLIIHTVKRRQHIKQGAEPSRYVIAKGLWEFRVNAIHFIRDVFLLICGVSAAAFGLESFLLPNNFIDGGATGISLLLAELTSLPLSLFLIVVNIPFIFLGYKLVGKEFAIKTGCAISALAILVSTIHFPEITHDKLLVSVFGGFFLGAGIGLSIRGGGVLDGTEVLAIALSRKFRTTLGDIIIILNVIIFGFAAYFLSIEAALYSMITYLSASKTLDFVIEGIEEYTGITIISSHHEEIRQMIINKIGRGVTIYKGKGGYGKRGESRELDIIFTVITRLELSRMNTEIEKID
ncbi:MAG: YitT family protein, partial [Bacteroidota bacterium]